MPKTTANTPVKAGAAKPAKAAAKPAPSRKRAPVPSTAAAASKPGRAVMARPVVAKPAKAKTVAPAQPVDKAVKLKTKLVRDSFTMPVVDFSLIDALKERALGFRRPTKKSELLRAGLRVLITLPGAQLEAVLNALEPLKPGRPKKEV